MSRFRSKKDLFEVEAHQVNFTTVDTIAEWCGGVVVEEHGPHEDPLHKAINVPSPDQASRASDGMWVLKTDSQQFHVCGPIAFAGMYEPV